VVLAVDFEGQKVSVFFWMEVFFHYHLMRKSEVMVQYLRR
jgi:hypothetical protein